MANKPTPQTDRLGRRFKLVRGNPQKVASILSMALRKHGLEKKIATYEFVLHWDKIVGVAIAERTRAESIERGVLLIRCVNSEWAQELTFQKDIIIRRLNQFLAARKSNETVTDVRFAVGPLRKAG